MDQNLSQPNTTSAPVNPEPQNLPDSPITEDSKKHSPTFYIVSGIISVAAIIAIIIFANIIINNNKKPATQTQPTQAVTEPEGDKSEEKKPMTAAEKEAAVKETLASLKAVAENPDDESSLTFQDVYDTYSPIYVPKNAKTGMKLDKTFGIESKFQKTPDYTSADFNAAKIAAKAIEDELVELGFDLYDEISALGDTLQYINEDNGVICGGVPTTTALPISITCGHTSWITTEKIAFINSLAEAYYDKKEEYPVMIDASKDNIEDSVFEPYQRITASMIAASAIFYRSSPTSDWVFFAAGQVAPACAEYAKDAGARRAFQGQSCIDASGGLGTVTAG